MSSPVTRTSMVGPAVVSVLLIAAGAYMYRGSTVPSSRDVGVMFCVIGAVALVANLVLAGRAQRRRR